MRRSTSRLLPIRRARLVAVSFVVVVVASMVAFNVLSTTSVGTAAEVRSIDGRFRARGERPMSRDVTMVAIDNQSDAALRERWPYRRSTMATVIENLSRAGARAIVLDVQFLEPTTAADDGALVRAIAATGGRVVLATAPETIIDPQGRARLVTPLPMRGFEIAGMTDPLAESGAIIALARPDTSADGAIRSIPVRRRVTLEDGSTQVMPSLSMAALAVARDESVFEQRSLPDSIDINYRGPSATLASAAADRRRRVRVVSIADVARGSGSVAWARDGVVFIGATSPVLQDLHESPFAAVDPATSDATTLMPGVESHINAFESLRRGDWITQQSLARAEMAAAVLVLLIWTALVVLPILPGILVAAGIIGAWVWHAQRVFSADAVELQVAPVVGTAVVALLATVITLVVAAWRDRRRITSLFSRYVSPEIVRELRDVREGIELGGERREVTIMFADIRGFTSMAEHADPDELVRELNEYFAEVVEAVEGERGTLDKFIGDGMMAVFGAPLPMDDHAERACAAARNVMERLRQLNERRASRALAPLEVGIGIHLGEVIVGNIGSPSRRVEYTAIGDAVNLAARLEAATRGMGVGVLVSSDVAARVSDTMHVIPRGSITVKGRIASTEVFELVTEAESPVEGATTAANALPEPPDHFTVDPAA